MENLYHAVHGRVQAILQPYENNWAQVQFVNGVTLTIDCRELQTTPINQEKS